MSAVTQTNHDAIANKNSWPEAVLEMYRVSAATHCRTDPEIAAVRTLPHPP